MSEEGMPDWDAALVELLAEEEAYLNAANL